jgi:hypothetical protein
VEGAGGVEHRDQPPGIRRVEQAGADRRVEQLADRPGPLAAEPVLEDPRERAARAVRGPGRRR